MSADLFGTPAGRRTEHVEWGLRSTVDSHLARRGEVIARPSEADARAVVGNPLHGWADTEVVSRTVVTFTTDWEAS